MKPEIWVMLDYYLPGYKSGGPVRSIANLVDALGDEFDFRIMTFDRDQGSSAPYREYKPYSWTPVGKASVMYLPPGLRSIWSLWRQLRRAKPRVLYLNSLFSRTFSLVPMLLWRLGFIDVGCVILAPKGELSEGALRIKNPRKRLFLALSRTLRIYRDVLWQASTAYETADIRANLFNSKTVALNPPRVLVARDLGKQIDPNTIPARQIKPAGELRIVFLSRICRKKNLRGALEMVNALKGCVNFTIYGPIEDPQYWKECEAAIASLPTNVLVRYAGEVPHDLVREILSQHDMLLLPTFGENFGHVILEALQSGCPVIISDQTAFRNLEAGGAGWDLPLESVNRFQEVLQKCIDMTPLEFKTITRQAIEYASTAACSDTLLHENRALLLAAHGPDSGCTRSLFLNTEQKHVHPSNWQ